MHATNRTRDEPVSSLPHSRVIISWTGTPMVRPILAYAHIRPRRWSRRDDSSSSVGPISVGCQGFHEREYMRKSPKNVYAD
ncbi:hypothetical protein PABG_11620 [Paracoccidioides brasiliensis Pb03]|nr:hypothetical protein PABG_11620 [Paracoccidioides brasiliensis Pb03]